MEQRGKRRPVHMPTLQGWVDLVFEDHHPSSQRHPPYDVEVAALQEWGFSYNPTRDEDRAALRRMSWAWPTACAWIAWQTFEGAAAGVAAFRTWRGRVWRESAFNARPGRLVLLPAAELDLRNALEAGKLSAEAVRGGDVTTIGAGEWPRLAWETNKHDEVIDFDCLLMLGAPRYEGVTLPRAAVMRLWPALDGWMPDEVVGVVEDAPTEVGEPIDATFREMAEDGVANDVPLLTPPPTRQERLNAIAREMPTGLQWKRGGSKKVSKPIEYQFHRALEGEFGEHVSRDGEAWEAWRYHYPYKPKSSRPRRSDQK